MIAFYFLFGDTNAYSMADIFNITVNGKPKTITTERDRTLLEVLREDLLLTGTKYGCGEGACGACTVLIDGVPTYTCSTQISEADKKSILTIEGLADGEKLHPVQEAFADECAFQCGFCTAGMIMGATALLKTNPNPSDAQITEAMNGHVCRCCGYVKILAAVHRAAELLRG